MGISGQNIGEQFVWHERARNLLPDPDALAAKCDNLSEPALTRFYGALSDEQKERFNRLSPPQG
jgi:hypothetical protein